MKQSQKLNDLLRELEEIGYSQIFGSSARRIALLESIGQTAEVLAVPRIVRFLLFPSKIATAASNAIENLMEGACPEEVLWLESVLRTGDRLVFGKSWSTLTPTLFKKIPQKIHTMGVLCSHPNGRVRQAAVQSLASFEQPGVLPYLLVRCNDWVWQVSSLARDIVEKKLKTIPKGHFFHHLFFVLKLADYQRNQNADILDTVLNELTRSGNSELIKTTLTNPNRFVRRRVFQCLSSTNFEIQNSILDVCFSGKDQLLRLKAFKASAKRSTSEEFGRLVERFRHDKSVAIRRERLIGIVSRLGGEATTELQLSLFDRSQTIRSFAKVQLRKRGVNVHQHYEEALQKGVSIKEAVSGLSDSREKSHAELIRNHLVDPRPKVRRECIKALSSMLAENETDLFLLHSKDENSKVSSESIRSLTNRVHLVDLERLRKLYFQETRLGPKIELIRLIDRKGSWDGVPVLLEILGKSDQTAPMVEKKLLSRINRVYTKPTEKVKNEIFHQLQVNRRQYPNNFERKYLDWFEKLTGSSQEEHLSAMKESSSGIFSWLRRGK